MRTATQALAGLALVAAASCFFVDFELLREQADPLANSSADLLSNHYPTLQYGFAQLRAGSLPLWNPHQSCGTPFLALPNIGFFYPFYLPFLFLPAEKAVTLDIGLHLTLAAFGTFLLCRHFAMAWAPSLLGGLIYAYAGPMLLRMNFPDNMAAAAWLPLLFLFVDRAFVDGSRRTAAALGLALGVALLGGHPQYFYYAALALLPLLLARSLQQARAGDWRRLGRGIIAAGVGTALGLAVAMIRILPSASYMQETWRASGIGAAQGGIGLAPRVFASNVFDPREEPYPPRLRLFMRVPRQAYVGTLSLALALVGMAAWRQRAISSAFVLSGTAAVLYSFGNDGFFYPWIFHLPGGDWFRLSHRALLLFSLSMAILAAAGLQVLSCEEGRGFGRQWVAALLALAAAAFVTALAATAVPGAALAWVAVYAALVALFGTGIALSRSTPRAVLVGSVVVLAFFDLLHAHRFEGALPSAVGRYYARNEPLFEQIRQRQGLSRTYIWGSMGIRDLPLRFHSDVAKAGMLHGLWLATDYEPSATRRMAEYQAKLFPNAPSFRTRDGSRLSVPPFGWVPFYLSESNLPLFNLLGIRFVLVEAEQQALFLEHLPDWQHRFELLREHAGVRLFEYHDALPRTFLVDRVESAPREEMLDRMAESDLRSVAFVETAPAPASAATRSPGSARAEASIVAYGANRVGITVDTDARRLLVLTDQFDSGWKARVDGRPTEVLRTDYLFRGVWVPPGRHVVDFTYWPATFTVGLLGSVGGLLGIGLLAFRSPSPRPIGGALRR